MCDSFLSCQKIKMISLTDREWEFVRQKNQNVRMHIVHSNIVKE